MINANELRIGNLIYLEMFGCYERVKATSFEMIEDDFGGYHAIPLSPEILVQCGFKRVTSSAAYWMFRRGEYEVATAPHSNLFALYSIRNGAELCKIKYLHQLQNLYFALIGEELPINL